MSKQLLRDSLANDAAVAALVGDDIWPSVIPQGTQITAALTYQRVVVVPANTLNVPATLDRTRYQVNSWAMDYIVADDLAKKARLALEAAGFRLEFEIDAQYEEATRRHGVRQDYFHHQTR